MIDAPLMVICNRAGATDVCKTCRHGERHEEIMYDLPAGMIITHKTAHTCSEGGKVRCIPAKR